MILPDDMNYQQKSHEDDETFLVGIGGPKTAFPLQCLKGQPQLEESSHLVSIASNPHSRPFRAFGKGGRITPS